MSMIACKGCRRNISASAAACPHCGKPVKGNRTLLIIGCLGAGLFGIFFVFIALIIAAIAIPNLLRARMAANEASAAGIMRTIAVGESAFQGLTYADANDDGVGDFGTLAQLADPKGDGTEPPLIDSDLASGGKFEYVFTIEVREGTGDTPPGFVCLGVPQIEGRTGFRKYYLDETGVIRFTMDNSEPNANSPLLN